MAERGHISAQPQLRMMQGDYSDRDGAEQAQDGGPRQGGAVVQSAEGEEPTPGQAGQEGQAEEQEVKAKPSIDELERRIEAGEHVVLNPDGTVRNDLTCMPETTSVHGVQYIRADLYNGACRKIMDLESTIEEIRVTESTQQSEGTAADTVDSTSDDRTVNNTMRHQYKVLTDEEKAHMLALKDAGLEFIRLLHKVGGTPETINGKPAGQGGRGLSVAQTKIQEAVFWAVWHVTE